MEEAVFLLHFIDGGAVVLEQAVGPLTVVCCFGGKVILVDVLVVCLVIVGELILERAVFGEEVVSLVGFNGETRDSVFRLVFGGAVVGATHICLAVCVLEPFASRNVKYTIRQT